MFIRPTKADATTTAIRDSGSIKPTPLAYGSSRTAAFYVS